MEEIVLKTVLKKQLIVDLNVKDVENAVGI
jgi:hypothetical protein